MQTKGVEVEGWKNEEEIVDRWHAEVKGRVRALGGEGVRSGDGGLWAIAGTVRPRAYWADPDGFTPVGGTEASRGRSSVQSTLVVH